MSNILKIKFFVAIIALPIAPAFAHTISIGYENSGLNNLTFWYGTYHNSVDFTEGSLRLVGPGLDSTLSYDLLVTNKPAGLADGATNFYSAAGYTTLESTNVYGSPVQAWQGKEFTNLTPGTYTFTYVPIPDPTDEWAPINNPILSSSVTVITADLDNVTQRLDNGMVFDQISSPSPLIFDGGTLRPTATATMSQVVSLADAGGTVDTDGHDLTLSGNIDGRGLLTKGGAGTLFITGNNTSIGGLAINGGIVNVIADNNLGAPGADIDFGGGTLQFGAAFDMSGGRDITLNAGGGTIDTQGFTTTISQGINGSGNLNKNGNGTLILSGVNTYTGTTTIGAGTLALSGGGSIATSAGLINSGIFDISQTTSGTSVSTISGSGSTELGSKTLTITNGSGTYAGVINGTGTVVVNGGTQGFTGNNTFSGGLTVAGGTIEIGSDGGLGTGTLTIGNGRVNATNAFTTDNAVNVTHSNSIFDTQANNVTLAGVVGGNGTLHKNGAGTLTLTGNNAITGGLNIDQGILAVSSAGNLGGSAVTIGTGTLQVDNSFTTANGVVLTNANSTINTQASELTLTGIVAGNGVLNKSGSGALILGGANTFSGGINLDAGILAVSSDANFGSGTINIGAGTLRAGGAFTGDNTIVLTDPAANINTQTHNVTLTNTISGSGILNKSGSGILTLGGTNTFSGGLAIGNGAVAVSSDANLGSGNILIGPGTLRVDSNFTTDNGVVLTHSTAAIDTQANTLTISNPISGSGSLNKTGIGTLILNGVNTYTGATQIAGGTLALTGNGNIASSSTVANNGTLDISGTSGGAHVTSLTGNGNTVLGSRTLTIDNASGTYAGAITGSGGVHVVNGTQGFGGTNTYSGGLFIDGGQVEVTSDANLGNGAVTIGNGVLRTAAGFTTDNAITLTNAASTINTGAHDLTIAGPLSGAGTLVKTGSGTLTLTGTNNQDGINIAGGTVAFNSDAALGAPGSTVIVQDNTQLRTLADMTITHHLFVNNALSATFDTSGHNVEIAGDIGGAGIIQKLGAGTLKLTGTNTSVLMLVQAGNLEVGSQAAAGAIGGDIYINQDGSFVTSGPITITQNVHITGENASINTNGNEVILTGNVDGSACLNKTGAGRLDMRADSSNAVGACVREGELAFNSTFTGNVFVFEEGTAGGTGQIVGDVQVEGTLSPGNSPGQLFVAGSVTQAPGSSYLVDIDGPTAGNGAGYHDQVVLTGAGSIYTADGTIQPRLRGITGAATNTYTPVIGDTFNVISAQGGVTGSYTGLTQPTEGLPTDSRFDVIYRPNDILLAVTPTSYEGLMRRTSTDNAAAVGRVLDASRGPAGVRNTSAAAALVDSMTGLDPRELSHTLQQAGGEVHADAMDATARASRNTRDVIRRRLDQMRIAGAVGEPVAVDKNLWAIATTTSANIESDHTARGYETRAESLTLGTDRVTGKAFTTGLALSYSTTDLDADWLGESTVKSYQALIYTSWQPDRAYVNAIAAIGFDDYETQRRVDLSDSPRSLNSDASGTTAALDLETGYQYAFDAWRITPAMGISYDRIDRESFTEDGDEIVALRVGDDTRDSVRARIGARMQTNFNLGNTPIAPYANLFAVRELADQSASVSPTLLGGSFEVEAADPGRSSVEVGVGVNAQIAKQANIYIDYNADAAENAFAYSVKAGFRYNW